VMEGRPLEDTAILLADEFPEQFEGGDALSYAKTLSAKYSKLAA